MKITVLPDGTIQMDVANGDGQTALDLIRSLQAAAGTREATKPVADEPHDESLCDETASELPAAVAALTPKMRQVYEALDQYVAAHYYQLAEDLQLSKEATNQRLGKLARAGIIRRTASGVYTTELS